MQTLIAPGRTIAPVTGTTAMGTVMTSEREQQGERWWAGLAWLTPEHVARVWTDERQAIAAEQAERRHGSRRGKLTARESTPVSEETVRSYLRESRPKGQPDTRPRVGGRRQADGTPKRGRYEDFPMPEPVPGRALIWVPGPGRTMDDLVHELRTWWRERPMQTRDEQGFYAERDTD